MIIKNIDLLDIPMWITLSKEYDRYVIETGSDLTEWYQGNEISISFEKYMKAKIEKNEAFMAVDDNDTCCGAIAVSKTNNNITFFAISHRCDFELVGNLLLKHAFSVLDSNIGIKVNIIKSKADHIKKQQTLFLKYCFNYLKDDLENGVSVTTLAYYPT